MHVRPTFTQPGHESLAGTRSNGRQHTPQTDGGKTLPASNSLFPTGMEEKSSRRRPSFPPRWRVFNLGSRYRADRACAWCARPSKTSFLLVQPHHKLKLCEHRHRRRYRHEPHNAARYNEKHIHARTHTHTRAYEKQILVLLAIIV